MKGKGGEVPRVAWKTVKLGEILDFYNGKGIKPFSSGRYPVYGSNGIIGYSDTQMYSNAIILGRVGTCGSVTREKKDFWASDNTIVTKAKTAVADLDFCYYLLKTLHLSNYAGGAAQPLVTQKVLRQIGCKVPERIEVQLVIAGVLCGYDEMVENNRRRMMLLEKMARELYREMFVRREKFEAKPLGEIARFVRGKVITEATTETGEIPVVAGGLEPAYYHNQANTEAPVITVSGSGANAGFTRMYFEKIWASDCSWADSQTTPYLRFVYCFLKNNEAAVRNKQNGAAQPHVYAKDINALSVPYDKIRIEKFEKLVTPYFDEIANLALQTRKLEGVRDRLLPRLMSGKLSVEGVHIV